MTGFREAIQNPAGLWIASSRCSLRKRFAFVAGNDMVGDRALGS
jgi:hypothetical protein